jgi:hypothetical protein
MCIARAGTVMVLPYYYGKNQVIQVTRLTLEIESSGHWSRENHEERWKDEHDMAQHVCAPGPARPHARRARCPDRGGRTAYGTVTERGQRPARSPDRLLYIHPGPATCGHLNPDASLFDAVCASFLHTSLLSLLSTLSHTVPHSLPFSETVCC